MGFMRGLSTTNIWHLREGFLEIIRQSLGASAAAAADRVIAGAITCYAAKLHLNKGLAITNPGRRNNPGYAPAFERLTRYPGRVAVMARKQNLLGKPDRSKPWLEGCPRLVFVSDMGDAFSRDADFGFLEEDVIAPIRSPKGQRHLWLWLTKRPERMARFSERIGGFPENVCAMTTITGPETLERIDQLRGVKVSMRGISAEPLRGNPGSALRLAGIDWLIVGGESGRLDAVHPFHLSWARELREVCRRQNVAFFIKQLGRRPLDDGELLGLKDRHGGDWEEWPEDLRIREVPGKFRR
jgi:protein gp37